VLGHTARAVGAASKRRLIADLLPILVLAAVLGARLYYVALEWRQYQLNVRDAWRFWAGRHRHPWGLIAGHPGGDCLLPLAQVGLWNLLRCCSVSCRSPWAGDRPAGAIFFHSEALGLGPHLPWNFRFGHSIGRRRSIDEAFFHPTLSLRVVLGTWVFWPCC